MKKKTRGLSLEKRQAILESAIELFYKQGYESASMDMISTKANVSKATVYRHFSNKEALFAQIVEKLKKAFENTPLYAYDVNKPLEEQLESIAKNELRFLSNKEHIILLQIITIALFQQNPLSKKAKSENYDKMVLSIQGWLEDAKKDKKLSFENSAYVADEFLGYIKTFAFYPQLHGAKILSLKMQEKVAKGSVEMILKLYGTKDILVKKE